MTPPVPKRRRLNAPSALHKPFKSPFRAPLQGNPNPPETPPSSDGPEPQTHPSANSAASSFTTHSPHLQPKRLHQTTTPLPSPRRPETHLLRTPYSASATAQISSLRSTIHTLEQATQLLQNPAADAALEDLIHKWRSASRAAAEELYASSRDRVNRMGGVGAWRDREKDQKKKVLEWEEDALHADDGNSDEDEEDEEDEEWEEDGEGERKRIGLEEKELRREAKKEAKRAAREQKKWQLEQLQEKKEIIEERMDGGGRFHDDDSFTMDMMLKALSIELEVIGYSQELQQWVG